MRHARSNHYTTVRYLAVPSGATDISPDLYFFFGGEVDRRPSASYNNSRTGFHLLFSLYMIIGIPSTGSAGLINTISAFSRGAIVVGVLGIIATVGWVLQGVGNAWYYRQVSRPLCTRMGLNRV